jgi:hypothetical protein
MNPRFVYIVTHPGDGCDPDSDEYIAYLKPPRLSWDTMTEFRTFSIDSFDPDKQLWALVERTAGCCGTGHKTLIVAYSRSRLRSMATVLNDGTPKWSVVRTDHEHRDGIRPRPYSVIPLDVRDEPFDEYVYAPSLKLLDTDEFGRDDWTLDEIPELGLSEDVFADPS